MSPKDMYADLENIEARGKRKKEKKGGLFSFGKKDEPAQESHPQPSEPPTRPAAASANPEPKPVPQPIAQPTPQPKPKPEPQPVAQPAPQPKPEPRPAAQPALQPKSEPRQEPKPQKPSPAIQEDKSGWKPLTGGKLDKANNELHEYKKWLNKGYKSGVLTKDQCTGMVRDKEIELGLRPPE